MVSQRDATRHTHGLQSSYSALDGAQSRSSNALAAQTSTLAAFSTGEVSPSPVNLTVFAIPARPDDHEQAPNIALDTGIHGERRVRHTGRALGSDAAIVRSGPHHSLHRTDVVSRAGQLVGPH